MQLDTETNESEAGGQHPVLPVSDPADLRPAPMRKRVAKNTLIYLVAQLMSWTVSLLALSVIPRTLGERRSGEWAIAMVPPATIATLLMFGIDQYVIREIGRDRAESSRLFNTVLGLRLALLLPFSIAVVISFMCLRASHSLWVLGGACAVQAYLGFLGSPIRAVLSGQEQAGHVSLLDLAAVCAPLLALPFLRYGAMPLVLASLTVAAISYALQARRLARAMRILPTFVPSEWWRVVRGGLPFQANNLILSLYSMSSVFILRSFTNDAAVGVFTQGSRLPGTLMFIPTALSSAILPSLARLSDVSQEEFRRVQTEVLELLIVLGLPLTVSVVLLAQPFCHLLYGADKFREAPAVMQVGALTVIPLYIVSTMYQFLVAQGRAKSWTLYLGATVAINAAASFVLVPAGVRLLHNGAAGAAAATLVAETCGMCFALRLLGTGAFGARFWLRLIRGALAAAGMGVVTWATSRYMLVVPIVASAVTFAVLAWVLQVLTKEEQARLLQAVRSRLRRR